MARPRVIVYSVASLDGKTALTLKAPIMWMFERWQEVAGSGGFDVMKWLRAAHDPKVVLEGSGSFVPLDVEPEPLPPPNEDPAILLEDFLPSQVVDRPGHRGWFTVVDGRGRIRNWIKEWPGEEWAGWHVLVLVSNQTPINYLAYLRREMIPYLVAGSGPRVDLGLAFAKLGEELGVGTILSEAGGTLNGALLKAGLVDEINVEFAPVIIGGAGTPGLLVLPRQGPDDPVVKLRLIWAQVQADGRIWVRYEVAKEMA